MGYLMDNGRWANTEEVELFSGTLEATGNGVAVELGDRGTLRLDLVITAVSGTAPKLDVELKTSKDGVAWTSLGSFTQATGPTAQRKVFPGCDRYVRASYTLTGTDTPTVTFSLVGEAV